MLSGQKSYNSALCVNLFFINYRQPLLFALCKMKLPEGYHTITPYFTVSDADQLLEFLVEAFGGAIVATNRYPTGRIQHARVRVGDSVIMINESNEQYPVNVSQIHLYVDDVEIVFSKALSAGAVSIMEPNERPHGDRMAGVKDPCENIWWIATHANL
jgi:PhnB protein